MGRIRLQKSTHDGGGQRFHDYEGCTAKIPTGHKRTGEKQMGGTNPRTQNGTLRKKYRARFRAAGAPCGICKGKLGPIHYDEPGSPAHPLSFVIDEIKPVSRWREFGYHSAKEAAEDFDNLQAAHYSCNAVKSNKVNFNFGKKKN